MTGRIDKAAVLELIGQAEKDAATSAIPSLPAQSETVAAFSLAQGLDCSFTQLVLALSMNKLAYWRQVFEALPDDASTGGTAAVVRRWVIWLWSDPEIGLRRRISDPTLLARCDAVCEMHRQVQAGQLPSRSEWRQARSAIAKAHTTDVVEVAAAEGGLAAAG